ncbi:NAD binding oxidoreductase [Histoplasma capsulatum]|uniref:D-xylose 1-dehydrogenase (NADP(+), D-xylono-1,5-lactone-forming) n=1 Tax=Ajellomyces capsulatus TaxID=5037 RepID=A0A8A1MAH3_AJECA|nr:NAD binding oxidoreductase [Histoplasma capsulatum]
MAMLLQISTFLQQWLYSRQSVRAGDKSPGAVRFGVLSTAMINPASIIHPIETHPGAVITAIASRNLKTAQVAAKRYSIERAYGSYEELLQDPEIDAIYISLPNGMHAEWAKKAMDAGKHVLIEKPAASNAEEATVIFDAAKKTNRVALEAFHWQFHPAAHVVRSLIESGRYGRVISTASRMTTPANSIPRGDIRWQYDLAGGSLMDMTYVVSSTRYFLDAGTPQRIDYAKARPLPSDKRVDEAMDARMYFKSEVAANSGLVKSDIKTDMNQPYIGHIVPRVWEAPSILIELEHANIYFYNFMMPHVFHYIEVTDKRTGQKHTQKHYNFGPEWGACSEPWWSTYRYQLEAFVDKVTGKKPVHWISHEDSVAQMRTLDAIYEKSGLGKRPSNFTESKS